MKRILADIQEGRFVNDFMLDNKVGQIKLKASRAKGESHQIEEVGARLRAMMPWLKENQKVDKTRN